MDSTHYNMSFTTGGLFQRESLLLARLYLELGNWGAVRERVMAENLLQARTLNTRVRLCREVMVRLEMLSPEELSFFMQASRQEQAYLLWIAVCRRHRFVAEFAVEVLRERYLTLKPELTHSHFDAFFNQKAEWNVGLDQITPATRNKLRQVLFRMLREADLVTSSNVINAAMLTPQLCQLIYPAHRQELQYFPVFDADLQGIIR